MATNLKEMLSNIQTHVDANPDELDEMLQQADEYRKEWAERAQSWQDRNQNLFNKCANYANDFNAAYELLSKIKGGK